MKSPVCLFRSELDTDGEHLIASKYLQTVKYRTQVPPNSTVIGRYSVLPYYRDLEQELALNGSRLINTWQEHSFIADVLAWGSKGGILDGLTPPSWPDWSSIPEGSYVLKGKTNSRKSKWNTHMFAKSLADIPNIAKRLYDDALISEQGIVVRKYVPLQKISEGLNGLPITNEWRTFWYAGRERDPILLGKGFYWASHPDAEQCSSFGEEALELAYQAAERISPYATFFSLDIAETESGSWTVIEVNDGQMSGLSCIDPEAFYRCLGSITDTK